MTAQEVIDLDAPEALTAWKSLPEHLATLQRIAAAQVQLSEALGTLGFGGAR